MTIVDPLSNRFLKTQLTNVIGLSYVRVVIFRKLLTMQKIFFVFALAILLVNCKKTNFQNETDASKYQSENLVKKGNGSTSSVITIQPFNVSPTTCETGGTVSGKGFTETGVCYNTSSAPTTANFKVLSGSTASNYSCFISGLNPATTYYVRAYGIKSSGTSYGNEFSFTTLSIPVYGSATDIDGNEYRTIQIGNKTWMADNLKTTRYRDGTSIVNHKDAATWASLTYGVYCDYNDDPNVSETYGRLYNWQAAADTRNIAPAGWHVATQAEWTELSNYLGGSQVAGGKLKEEGTDHWLSPNTYASNLSGFDALGAGIRLYSGSYSLQGSRTDFIVRDASSRNITLGASTGSLTSQLHDQFTYWGRSIRCVKD